MRAFIRGERLTALLILLFALLLLTTCVCLAVTISAHADAGSARHSAHADRAALNAVTAALRLQCSQQSEMQTRLRQLEQSDVDLQRGLIAADNRNALITKAVRAARRAVYERKLTRDLQFLALPAPSPAVCAPFSRTLPTSFRAVQ